jgi:DNA-binding transcriptional MerR regulator
MPMMNEISAPNKELRPETMLETRLETLPDISNEMSGEISGEMTEESQLPQDARVAVESVPLAPEELILLKSSLPDPRMEAGAELVESLENIPDKMAFKIGEAAEMVGVKQYVLRYWESEFEMLKPRKSKNNQRVYSRRDVETALMIKKLLYQDRFSIEGARSALRQLKVQVKQERGIKAIVQSQDTAVAKLKGLLLEVQRVREIFN